jgi:DNA-binding CsgD family transcriptional regulator
MAAWARNAHENPLIVEYLRTGDGRPRRISDVMDTASFRRLALYQEFYGPVGVETQVAFTLPARPPLLLGLALSRGPEDYSDAEVELLGLARPHLIQAYRQAELSTARAAALAAVEGGLEALGRHVVVLDPHGRVEFATESARRLCGDGLPAAVRDWLAGARGARPMADPLILGTSLIVRLLPGGRADRRDVLLLEPGTGELSVVALRSLQLTEREAEALRWVALGRSPDEAAVAMGIARRTLDKHLQRIYAKLGVTSLSQAVATAWAAVGGG